MVKICICRQHTLHRYASTYSHVEWDLDVRVVCAKKVTKLPPTKLDLKISVQWGIKEKTSFPFIYNHVIEQRDLLLLRAT